MPPAARPPLPWRAPPVVRSGSSSTVGAGEGQGPRKCRPFLKRQATSRVAAMTPSGPSLNQ